LIFSFLVNATEFLNEGPPFLNYPNPPDDALFIDSPYPTEEAPVDEVRFDEVAADAAPADEIPANEVPADEVPADELPAENVPVGFDPSNLKETLSEKSKIFLEEIRKALNADITDHPPKESLEYYKAAERYAFFGKTFHDFPEDYSTLYDSKNFYMIMPETYNLGDGLYPIPFIPSTMIPNNYGVSHALSYYKNVIMLVNV